MPKRSRFNMAYRPAAYSIVGPVDPSIGSDYNDIEIARVQFKHGDLKCVRVLARQVGDRIYYRIQKDASKPYDSSPRSSSAPLSFDSLIDLIETNIHPGDVRHFNRSDLPVNHLADFVQADSKYYPGLSRWYEQEGREWARARKYYMGLNALLYAVIAIMSILSLTKIESPSFGVIHYLVMATIGISTASLFWSEKPSRNMLQTGRWLFILFSAIAISLGFTLVQIAVLIAVAAVLTVILGIIFDLATDAYLPLHRFRFSSIGHPNFQAVTCMSLLFSSAYLHAVGVLHWIAWAPLLTASVVLLLLTRSRNGFWLAMLTAIVWTALELLFSLPPTGFAILTVFAVVVAIAIPRLIVAGVNEVGELDSVEEREPKSKINEVVHLGRDPLQRRSFNGRFGLWFLVWQAVRKKPVLGYGYSAFWDSERDQEILRLIGWCPRSSHSIYLDTLLNVGPLGLILLLGILFAGFVQVLLVQDSGAVFIGTFLFYVAVSGVFESTFSTPNFRCFSFYLLACLIS